MTGSSRYWCPPTGRIALDGGGFLADPGDPFGFDQTLSTYDEIDHHRCLWVPETGFALDHAAALYS
ncbi:MAG: hypothetical protein ABR569_13505 [Gaiellaceae bacterium]